jgi:hypothetical protein
MGFITCIAPCFICKMPFSFNPDLVPSLTILNGRQVDPGTPGGVKEPFCLDCITKANVIRNAKGMPPLVPLPGAYDPQPETFADEMQLDSELGSDYYEE